MSFNYSTIIVLKYCNIPCIMCSHLFIVCLFVCLFVCLSILFIRFRSRQQSTGILDSIRRLKVTPSTARSHLEYTTIDDPLALGYRCGTISTTGTTGSPTLMPGTSSSTNSSTNSSRRENKSNNNVYYDCDYDKAEAVDAKDDMHPLQFSRERKHEESVDDPHSRVPLTGTTPASAVD